MTIDDLMTAWGIHSRSRILPKAARNPMARYFPSEPAPYISPENMERIDAGMLSLRAASKGICRVMTERYAYNLPLHVIAKRVGISQAKANKQHEQGLNFIEYYLQHTDRTTASIKNKVDLVGRDD